jgi:bifunctional DNA-binding transcriptional regulator/antitoxin component of YhaV-PrlF toxin-antitoxin module
MRVKIKQNENGEHYFLIPDELQKELSWNEGDPIEWIDNGDGSWTLKKLSKLEALKLKAFESPEVKAEYDRLKNCSIDELTEEESELKECLNAKPVGKEII